VAASLKQRLNLSGFPTALHFTHIHRYLNTPQSEHFAAVFEGTIDIVDKSIGKSAFRSQRVINAALFDGVMVGIARRMALGKIQNLNEVKVVHDRLIRDTYFVDLYTGPTTDERRVADRLAMATQAFADIV
jgi:hypothetical protein